jgi:hypothetical protein
MNSAGPTASLPVTFREKNAQTQGDTQSPAHPGISSGPVNPLLQSPAGDHDHPHEESGCACLHCSGNGACGRRESQHAQEEEQTRQ